MSMNPAKKTKTAVGKSERSPKEQHDVNDGSLRGETEVVDATTSSTMPRLLVSKVPSIKRTWSAMKRLAYAIWASVMKKSCSKILPLILPSSANSSPIKQVNLKPTSSKASTKPSNELFDWSKGFPRTRLLGLPIYGQIRGVKDSAHCGIRLVS